MNKIGQTQMLMVSDQSVLADSYRIASAGDDLRPVVPLPFGHLAFTHIGLRHHFSDAWCFFRASADSRETGAAGGTGDRRGLTDAGECLRY